MNRYVSRKSLLFFIATWCIAVALFADGINLDDLFPGTFVVHDDDDNPFSAGYVYDSLPSASQAAQHQSSSLPQREPQRQDSHTSSTHLQIVFDQDSPSLAWDPLAMHVAEAMSFADPGQIEVHQFSSSEPLHLLFRVLLI